jgi:hypothetical protein
MVSDGYRVSLARYLVSAKSLPHNEIRYCNGVASVLLCGMRAPHTEPAPYHPMEP